MLCYYYNVISAALLPFPPLTHCGSWPSCRNQRRRCWGAARSSAVPLVSGPCRAAELPRCCPAYRRRRQPMRAWATWTLCPARRSPCPAHRPSALVPAWAHLSLHGWMSAVCLHVCGVFTLHRHSFHWESRARTNSQLQQRRTPGENPHSLWITLIVSSGSNVKFTLCIGEKKWIQVLYCHTSKCAHVLKCSKKSFYFLPLRKVNNCDRIICIEVTWG